MRSVSRLRSWVRSAFHRSTLEREIDDELRFHVDQYVDDLVRAGVPVAEARRRAGVEFGGMGARKEDIREALGLRLLDEVTGDLRYAFRQLRRAPAFTAVAVLSLALGIGANTAIFSLMEAALWKSIPVQSPEELRLFSWVSGSNRVMARINGNFHQRPNGGNASESFSYPVFLELQQLNQLFDSIVGFKATGRITALVDGRPELLTGELVTGNFYRGVGVVPIVGRPIVEADDRQDAAEGVAVISYGYWTRRFGRDPSVVGKRISVNAAPVTIVGINPPEFTGVEPGRNPEIFLPLYLQPVVRPQSGNNPSILNDPDFWWLLVLGRLKSGVNESQAQAAVDVVFERAVRSSLPGRAGKDQPTVELLSGARGLDGLSEDFSRPLLVLLSLVGVVLLTACANVANLLLARAAIRHREISLRLALGAGRWRVARQLLTEGLALAVLGGAVGGVLGYWLRDVVPALLSSSWMPSPLQAEFNWRVVAISAVTTMATGVVFSLAPAWRSARVEINAALKDAGRVAFRLPRWWRGKPLVAFQVCLSVLLLVGAGLFVRTLSNLMSVNLGFQPDRILLFVVDPPRARYPSERRYALFDRLQERIGEIPGVETATLSSNPILDGGSSRTPVDPAGIDPRSPRTAWVNDVGYDFFETMGIQILYGRSFTRLDRAESQPVAVVNQRFVREFYPNENPLGRTFRNGPRTLQIVGVVADSSYELQRAPFPPTFYRAYLQEPPGNIGTMTYEVRTAASEASVIAAVREAVASIDSELPIFDIRTQNEQIASTVSQERLFVALTSAFAATRARACVYRHLRHHGEHGRTPHQRNRHPSRVGRRAPASSLDDPSRGGGARGDRRHCGRRRFDGADALHSEHAVRRRTDRSGDDRPALLC